MRQILLAAMLFSFASPAFAKLTATQIQALQSAGSMEIDAKDPDEVNRALIEAKHVTGKNVTISQKVFSSDGVGHYTIRLEN